VPDPAYGHSFLGIKIRQRGNQKKQREIDNQMSAGAGLGAGEAWTLLSTTPS